MKKFLLLFLLFHFLEVKDMGDDLGNLPKVQTVITDICARHDVESMTVTDCGWNTYSIQWSEWIPKHKKGKKK